MKYHFVSTNPGVLQLGMLLAVFGTAVGCQGPTNAESIVGYHPQLISPYQLLIVKPHHEFTSIQPFLNSQKSALTVIKH